MKRPLLFVALIMLLLAGCAKTRYIAPGVYAPDVRILPFEAQDWMLNLPQGEYAVGIGYADPMITRTSSDAAREFAVVSLSRNHSSYVVDKLSTSSFSGQTEANNRSAEFNVVVSQDMTYLSRAEQDLQQLNYFTSGGYFIGLYGFTEVAADTSRVIMSPAEIPAWSVNQGVRLDNGKIVCVASSRQASLMDAFSAAQELALRSVGQHLVRNVSDIMRTENEVLERSNSFETVTLSPAFCLEKIYVRKFRIDGLNSYELSLQLRERESR